MHEESAALPLADEPISLDELLDLAPAFLYERLQMYDGYGVHVEIQRAVDLSMVILRGS